MTDVTTEPWVVDARWDITYQHVADAVTEKFLATLRDEGRLLGRRCPACGRVLLPAASVCERDLEPTTEWVELPMSGSVAMATVVYQPIRGLPDPPYALAYVLVDGADTTIPVRIEGLDLDDPEAARAELAPGRAVALTTGAERRGRSSDLRGRLV
jgi:uncharacterized OB-fold protein